MKGIHRLPIDSSHNGQWCGPCMFSMLLSVICCWTYSGVAGDVTSPQWFLQYCSLYIYIWWLAFIFSAKRFPMERCHHRYHHNFRHHWVNCILRRLPSKSTVSHSKILIFTNPGSFFVDIDLSLTCSARTSSLRYTKTVDVEFNVCVCIWLDWRLSLSKYMCTFVQFCN